MGGRRSVVTVGKELLYFPDYSTCLKVQSLPGADYLQVQNIQGFVFLDLSLLQDVKDFMNNQVY